MTEVGQDVRHHQIPCRKRAWKWRVTESPCIHISKATFMHTNHREPHVRAGQQKLLPVQNKMQTRYKGLCQNRCSLSLLLFQLVCLLSHFFLRRIELQFYGCLCNAGRPQDNVHWHENVCVANKHMSTRNIEACTQYLYNHHTTYTHCTHANSRPRTYISKMNTNIPNHACKYTQKNLTHLRPGSATTL